MATIAVRKIAAADPVAAEEYFLPPQKLLQGNPRQTVWMHYTDPSAKFMVGIWHSERGRWTILYTEEEFCRILEGVSVLRVVQRRRHPRAPPGSQAHRHCSQLYRAGHARRWRPPRFHPARSHRM